MDNIEKLANLGGAVVTVILFLYYLGKRDMGLDKVINNHLQQSGKIIKDNSKALSKVFIALEKLSVIIGKNIRSQDIGNIK